MGGSEGSTREYCSTWKWAQVSFIIIFWAQHCVEYHAEMWSKISLFSTHAINMPQISYPFAAASTKLLNSGKFCQVFAQYFEAKQQKLCFWPIYTFSLAGGNKLPSIDTPEACDAAPLLPPLTPALLLPTPKNQNFVIIKWTRWDLQNVITSTIEPQLD